MIKIYDEDKFKGEIRAINGPFSIAYFGREEPSNATMQGVLNFRGKERMKFTLSNKVHTVYCNLFIVRLIEGTLF